LARTFHTLPATGKPKLAVVPAACVGPDHTVPAFMSYDGVTPSPLAGQVRPLCTQKLVHLQPAQNFNADFRIFTQVPVAGRLIGLTTDDLTLEFRQGNPRLGDKIGPSFMPVSIQDYKGNELVRGYTDEWGEYNMLVPSTFWTDTPNPTGVSPHMVNIILNPPFFADPVTRQIDPQRPDPFWKPGYPANQPFPMDIWPGKITYADTPMVPIRPAVDTTAIDCTIPDTTPAISQVNGPAGGPWVETPSGASLLTITSAGQTTLANPDPASPIKTLVKNYGFGASGSVLVTRRGTEFGSAFTEKLQVLSWSDSQIVTSGLTLDAGGLPGAPLAGGLYQLTVLRDDNHKTDISGITLHVGNPSAKVRRVSPAATGTPIQDAIDAADNGDLILVAPGFYPENVIMWKPVQLQGAGAYSTTISAGAFDPITQASWLSKLNAITNNQDPASPFLITDQQPDFYLEQGAAVTVLAPAVPTANLVNATPAQIATFGSGAEIQIIDGFTMTQANLGGAIFVNANANFLQISNNKLVSNNGTFGGGIRVGNPETVSGANPSQYVSSSNANLRIAHNEISFNGGTGFSIGSGGGIGLYKGSDNYVVSDNWVCGNYALLAGAGIAHQGLSNNGVIKDNTIIFNESFDEGAGILIAGELPISGAAAPANIVSEGAGNVTVTGNLIQGNKGGNLGGGIALQRYNGQEVVLNPANTPPAVSGGTPVSWYAAGIYNNMIVNNLSGAFGGGIGISDALDVTIAGNTIANNDSTATGELAFGNSTVTLNGADVAFTLPGNRQTTPLPAGIGVQPLSASLLGYLGAGVLPLYQNSFARNPVIVNDIIYGNRSYYWPGFDPAVNAGINILAPFAVWDLGVFTDPAGAAGLLNPQYSVLTETSSSYPQVKHYPYPGAGLVKAHDPRLVAPYRNSISASQGGAALGNFVSFTYSPMTLTGNYHILGDSSARGTGTGGGAGILSWNPILDFDFDVDSRAVPVDIGADQYNAKGDLNGDDQVNVFDAIIALQMAVGILPPNSVTPGMLLDVHVAPLSVTGRPAPGSATYNPPVANTVTISDALLILQRAVGLIFW
jgi:large repetitive protein